jgi:hypothetical protein
VPATPSAPSDHRPVVMQFVLLGASRQAAPSHSAAK